MRLENENNEYEGDLNLEAILDLEDEIIAELESMPQEVSRRVLTTLICEELLLKGVRFEDAENIRGHLLDALLGGKR